MRISRPMLVLILVLVALPAVATDWSRFRGPNGSGNSNATGLPGELDLETHKLWEAEVPFGRSSPVIAGDLIVLSATDEEGLVTLALDRATGAELWRKTVAPARSAEFHHDTDSSTPTPVTDGSNIYVFFQEFGLVSYDKKGKERWRRPLGPFRNFYSIAASPVLAGDILIMVCDQAEGSFIVAVDAKTGEQIWRRNRPARLEAYATPIVYPAKGEPRAVLVSGSRWLDAYDPKTGKNLWSIGDVGTGPVSSPVLLGDTVIVTAPNHAENGWTPYAGVATEHDKDKDGNLSREEVADAWLARHFGWLDHDGDNVISEKDWTTIGNEMTNENWGVYAIRLPKGETGGEKLWNYRKNVSDIASPMVYNGIFYMVHNGVLTSLDAETGELIKRGRIGEGSPKVYASPVAADGKIYLATLEGTVVVIEAQGEWTTSSSVDLGDEIWASPAIADGTLYVRTRGKLFSFGAASE